MRLHAIAGKLALLALGLITQMGGYLALTEGRQCGLATSLSRR